ncbi:hypothetical protein J4U01_gp050 [Mycobacterium phage Kumao]|uniref:Uncharacterized protein n=1 Tax=Mycobacterium phage Kumao TaxID=2041344 RepID=A0A2D1GPZ8_9CAUD|nr:hypothetical protein J4U01_gp050 [Mycobacterium phage Kumao]ATN94013.1 hypothetical protein SEA_KUMAO_50 [Mycobacterium phage Kumao]
MSTPIEIDRKLQEMADEIDLWDKMIAWHEAQRDYYKTRLAIAMANAELEYNQTPASKAKAYAISKTEKQRVQLDIAEAQLNLCVRRMHSLDKGLLTLMGRNKNAMQAYNVGGRDTW